MASIEEFKKQMLESGIDPSSRTFMNDPNTLAGYNTLFNTAQQGNVSAWNNNHFGVQDAYNTAMTALDWSPWLNGSADYKNAVAAQARTQNDEWFRKNVINNSDEFANRFGVRPDLAHIQSLFQDAVDEEYTAKRAGLAQSEAAYQQDLNDIKAETFRNIYNPNAAAATGASLGAQAANAMASAQNFEQEASQKAVQIAQQRENLVAEEAAARAQAALNAEQHYEDLALKTGQIAAEYNNPMAAFGTAKYAFDSNNRSAQATESAASTNATANLATAKMQTAGNVFGTTANMLNQSNSVAGEAATTGLQETGDLAQSSIQAQASIEAAKQGSRGYGTYTGGYNTRGYNPSNTYNSYGEDPIKDFDNNFNYNLQQAQYSDNLAQGHVGRIQQLMDISHTRDLTPAEQNEIRERRLILRSILNTQAAYSDIDKEQRAREWGLVDADGNPIDESDIDNYTPPPGPGYNATKRKQIESKHH